MVRVGIISPIATLKTSEYGLLMELIELLWEIGCTVLIEEASEIANDLEEMCEFRNIDFEVISPWAIGLDPDVPLIIYNDDQFSPSGIQTEPKLIATCKTEEDLIELINAGWKVTGKGM